MTHELVINGKTYEFNFGMAFMREIDKTQKRTVNGITQQYGLAYYIALVTEGDLDGLYTVLRTANRGFEPRLDQKDFDEWIDDDDTNIEEVFEKVEGFFEKSNSCKMMYKRIKTTPKEAE